MGLAVVYAKLAFIQAQPHHARCDDMTAREAKRFCRELNRRSRTLVATMIGSTVYVHDPFSEKR